jgi:hypothetical protein
LATTYHASYSYLWENGTNSATLLNGAGGDIYIVTVTDNNGCTDVTGSLIPEPLPVLLVINNVINESNTGANDGAATVVVAGGVSPYTYHWSNNETTSTIENLTAGTYNVTVTDANGCTNTTAITILTMNPILAANTMDATNISISPNPANEVINVLCPEKNFINATIFNANGLTIKTLNKQEILAPISLVDCPKGIYFIKLETNHLKVRVLKFLKE